MRIESKLCHLSENKAIVQVNGWVNDKSVGSALAEGSTVELAEDKAISRLNERINSINDDEEIKKINIPRQINNQIKVVSPKEEDLETEKEIEEPADWSNELTAIDSEIVRLNWSREDEVRFLEENLGYNNRNKITKYNELIDYLKMLKKISHLNSTKSKIKTLIKESDFILKELSWDHKKGREYLKNEYNVSTRKELDEKQLISFVSKLKSIRNNYLSK